jgi:uncharacterized protein YggU (UPF0235/DUF167 family)
MVCLFRIKPNQKEDRFERVNELWQVRLKAPAIDGKANDRLIRLLSEILDLPKSSIRIKKGHSSPLKYLDIDAPADQVNGKLKAAADSDQADIP